MCIDTNWEEKEDSFIRMACIERASPALKQILLKLYQ